MSTAPKSQTKPNTKPNSKKKPLKPLLLIGFILLNIAIIAWTAFSEFGDSDNAADLAKVQIQWWLLIPAALMFVIAVVGEVYKYYMLMRRTHSSPAHSSAKQDWHLASTTFLLGRYYDNITPAAIGGQPFQIYYMYKNGVQKGYDVVIPLIAMISNQLGFLLVGATSILIGSVTNAIWNPGVVAVGWIGLLAFAFFPVVILAATFLPKTTEEITNFIIKFLHKIHIVKDEAEASQKAADGIHRYTTGIKTILKEKGLFTRAILLGALYHAALLALPYFVLLAFGTNIGFFPAFATTAAVSAAVYFVPTPGNAGAAEGTFYSVFSVLPETGYVFWAMLIWRFFVYYLWLIIGFFTQISVATKDKKILQGFKAGAEKFDETRGHLTAELEAEERSQHSS